MRTNFVTKTPDPPLFVGTVRHHLDAAKALDNTVLDEDPAVGSVKVENDQLLLNLTLDKSGAVQDFVWAREPGFEADKERFQIHRGDKEEVWSHSTTETAAFDNAVLETVTHSAGFNTTDGGLLWVDNDTSFF